MSHMIGTLPLTFTDEPTFDEFVRQHLHHGYSLSIIDFPGLTLDRTPATRTWFIRWLNEPGGAVQKCRVAKWPSCSASSAMTMWGTFFDKPVRLLTTWTVLLHPTAQVVVADVNGLKSRMLVDARSIAPDESLPSTTAPITIEPGVSITLPSGTLWSVGLPPTVLFKPWLPSPGVSAIGGEFGLKASPAWIVQGTASTSSEPGTKRAVETEQQSAGGSRLSKSQALSGPVVESPAQITRAGQAQGLVSAPREKSDRTSRHIRTNNVKPMFLVLADVAMLLSVSESTIRRLIAQGRMPKPKLISARRVGWRATEIYEWAEARQDSELLPPRNTGWRGHGRGK